MAIIKGLKAEGTWRLIALAFGTSIVLRYVYWRTTNTLPPINQPENFIPGLLLYLIPKCFEVIIQKISAINN